ncbi:MAG TPA: WbqC family protein [Vicinamibacterales bacterium]|nr:WbqC family protein [Vicinamibacterales bacterium]
MSHKRVAIVQSSYIPWKGYFDLIRAADEFILLDDVQFTKRDWRSRNRIKTKDGLHWLTIPVHTKGRYEQRIMDTTISESSWGERHWQTIQSAYARTAFFDAYAPSVRALYEKPVSEKLSEVNRSLIDVICRALGIATPIRWSSEYHPSEGRNERLIDLCLKAGATDYLSGPSARGYMDEAAFARAGVTVQFVDYSGYSEYPQPYPPFEHAVSALDLLFCTGPRAIDYLKDLCPARVAS